MSFLSDTHRGMKVSESMDRMEVHRGFPEELDATVVRECERGNFATGLMFPNVCMDRQHGPVQRELIDQEHSEGTQHSGVKGLRHADE